MSLRVGLGPHQKQPDTLQGALPPQNVSGATVRPCCDWLPAEGAPGLHTRAPVSGSGLPSPLRSLNKRSGSPFSRHLCPPAPSWPVGLRVLPKMNRPRLSRTHVPSFGGSRLTLGPDSAFSIWMPGGPRGLE